MKSKIAKKAAVKLEKGFRPQIRSRHPSHNALRGTLPRLPFRSVVRLGSTTALEDPATRAGTRVEINPAEAIKNSSSKLRMKRCFSTQGVKTATWCTIQREHSSFITLHNGQNTQRLDVSSLGEDAFPMVSKHIYGSRGKGNMLHRDLNSLLSFLNSHADRLNEYIFEKYHNFTREYRLHVTADGCFYTCRKMLKEGTPEDKKWFRNDSNCVWYMEDNPQFDKPTNWKEIEAQCVRALIACGLDFGACDVRVQGAKNEKGKARKDIDFIIVEINSAPSFGEHTLEQYKKMLPELIKKKHSQKQ